MSFTLARAATPIVAGLALVLLAGCASQVPLISHTHVGHSLTGWVDTPNKAGLFETTEEYAARMLKVAERAQQNATQGDLSAVERNMRELESLIGSATDNASDAYSFMRAFAGTRDHIEFAIESDDVSPNLAAAGKEFLDNSEGVLERVEIMKAVAQTPLDDTTFVDVANEIKTLAVQTFDGEDADANGVVGNVPGEYGLKQLREELSFALNREDNPKYRPVEQRYLFGLVRLPDGTWKFRSINQVEIDGGGGGGGYD